MSPGARTATVIIPAHNEERGLRRLLPALVGTAGDARVIVVCNGCTDDSAAEARKHLPAGDVVELEQPSKAAALVSGGDRASSFPIAFVDADVLISGSDIRALADALGDGVHAVGPQRRLDLQGVSVPARMFYAVWQRLPAVRSGLFGRGVIMLSEAGFGRVRALPAFLSDDLAFSEAFSAGERRVVPDALVTIWPARTWRALVRRRVRVVQGNSQLSAAGRRSPASETGIRDLLSILGNEPRLLPAVVLFVVTALIARSRARRSAVEWTRDETSRVE